MGNNIRISVAMTTYNGELYVERQLQSIINQTRRPDEVVICDDGSKDGTVAVVNRFIKSNKLANWKIIINNPNLGWKANFFKAAGMTSGDIIFFSDQDDIWMDDKIEVMSSLMIEHRMGALYANKNIIGSDDNLLSERQEKVAFTNAVEKRTLNPSFFDLKTLGCCMCLNRNVMDLYQKLNFPEGGHDSQCGRIAILFDSLWYLDRPVINYRIHQNNTSGISGSASFGQSSRQKRVDEIRVVINWLDKIPKTFELQQEKIKLIERCLTFQKKRLGYFNGETPLIYLLNHRKYYTGWSMLIGDIAYKHGINKILGMIRWKIKKIIKL